LNRIIGWLAMYDVLHHLLPDFSLLSKGGTEALGTYFWLVMTGIVGCAVIYLIYQKNQFNSKVRTLKGLLAGQTRENLAVNRLDMQQKARGLKDKRIAALWQEFDDSLVAPSDQKQLFNTLDADHFFNARTLAAGLTGSRLLGALPGLLVGVGVLATFVGLTIGLANLKMDSAAGVDQLRNGISTMIQGAAVAFLASVWGVFYSLLLNVVEKWVERVALGKIHELQHQIDSLYPLIPAEQSLVHIAEHSRESKEALQELHERIGDRLQESLAGMNEAMQQALTDALNNIMGPAIQTLVSTTSQHSTQALEHLVSNFTSGLTLAGREQGQLMQQAAAEVNTAMSGMTGQLNQLFQSLNDQQLRQQAASQQQSSDFQERLDKATAVSDQRQQHLESRFGEMMSGLTGQLDAQLGSAHRRDEERQQLFERTLDGLGNKQTALLDNLEAASRSQLQSLAEDGAARQANLEGVFSRLVNDIQIQQHSHLDVAEQREQARAQRHEQLQTAARAQQEESFNRLGQASQQQITAIAQSTSAQQEAMQEKVGALLESFTTQMAGHGAQAEEREQVRQQRLAEQLERMVSQQALLLQGIAAAVQTTQQQSKLMAEQHQQLLGRLQQVSEAAATSSRHMDSSANQLGMLSANVRQAAELLGERLESVTQRIESAGTQNAQLASQLQGQAESLTRLQQAMLEGANRFEQAAAEARNGFGDMKSHQTEFLSGVRSAFTSLGDELREQVEKVERQAEQWLREYSSAVHVQVKERMDQWNTQTLSFATEMQATVNAISNVVDELEDRR
jgi:hypothetical protein